MRVVIQRVKQASIVVGHGEAQSMGSGLVVLFAASIDDVKKATPALIEKLANKTANLRIFDDEDSKMNLSPLELGLSLMVVSQFTLFADTKKGNRPSFVEAASSESAEEIYDSYVSCLAKYNWNSFITGSFGAHMDITLTNDGPVTIIIDTKEW